MNEEINKAKVEERAWRGAIREYTKVLENYPNNLQKYHTPYDLCNCIIGKLTEYAGDIKNLEFLCFNLEFAEVLIYDFGVLKEKIWFVTDCKEKAAVAKSSRYNGVNVILENFNEFLSEEWNMKFDVIVMNPPYQGKSEERKGVGAANRDIYPKFIERSLSLCKEDGFVANIHPRKWRKPETETWKTLTSKSILYLEMHSQQDGHKTFGAETTYDWYVLKNTNTPIDTVVLDENGVKTRLNLRDIPFLPSKNFDSVFNLLAKKDEGCEVIYSRTSYGSDKKWINDSQDDTHKYPVIYTINAKGTEYKYSLTNEKGHFGTPKVIVNMGRYLYPIIDIEGKYGMSNICFGIRVSDQEEAENIRMAIQSDKFNEIVESCRWMLMQFDWRIFKYFKKDFWKEFV